MSDPANINAPRLPDADAPESQGLETLGQGGKGESLRQTLKKPVMVVAMLLGLGVITGVWFLQTGSGALRLTAPAVSYELLQNHGLTEGVPIAITVGPLTVFKISDPMSGGTGAARAKAVVGNIEQAVQELIESPGRTITIDSNVEQQLPMIVQKASPNDATGLEVIRVSTDDVSLAGEEDPKQVARIWAERLTDGLKLLQFGEQPKFTRGSDFGNALETLYLNSRNENGGISTESIEEAFEELSDEQKLSLTTFPIPEKPEEDEEGDDSD